MDAEKCDGDTLEYEKLVKEDLYFIGLPLLILCGFGSDKDE